MRTAPPRPPGRLHSYGQAQRLTVVDHFGTWLSGRSVHRAAGSFEGKDVADIGCGYHASFVQTQLHRVASATLVDIALDDGLAIHDNVRLIVGELPDVLSSIENGSLDVVLCLSVLEHLWDPATTIAHFRRMLRDGGICVINVPSWLGKHFLELSAFRLGLSPACEMDDHKQYYNPRDLWPLLVRAGFSPHGIKVRRHKFGMNTIATCKLD